MSMSHLERMVWRAAQEVFKNRKLRLRDLCEWTTGNPDKRDDEAMAEVVVLGTKFRVCVLKKHDKRS